jgi:hypothetical protein
LHEVKTRELEKENIEELIDATIQYPVEVKPLSNTKTKLPV